MLLLLQVIVFVIQVQAFIAGAGHAWGVGTFGAIVAAIVISLIPGIGGVILGAVTFYGAYAAWGWYGWQALLLAAPGFALTIFALAGGAVAAFLSDLAGRKG